MITVGERATRIGERLRTIRRQRGLSLHDVEARSDLEFKASVLGAYERGERAISVPRLLRLADLYGVPADQLLPRSTNGDGRPVEVGGRPPPSALPRLTIDLQRLVEREEPEARLLARYAHAVQVERQDFNGRLLTIRRDDVRILAASIGRTPEDLVARYEELGLRGHADH